MARLWRTLLDGFASIGEGFASLNPFPPPLNVDEMLGESRKRVDVAIAEAEREADEQHPEGRCWRALTSEEREALLTESFEHIGSA